MPIKHAFTNPKSDQADASDTRPSDWNADHIWTPDWTTYTPAWTASTTNPSIGNGVLTGRWRQTGEKTYELQITIVVGSTTAIGSGQYALSLPAGWQTPNDNRFHLLPAHLLDSGTAHFVALGKIIPNGTTINEIIVADATGSRLWAHNVPITLAVNDAVNIGIGQVVIQ